MEFRSRRKHHAKGLAIKALGINSVLIALAFACLESIWPIYVHDFFPSSSQVGFVTSGLAVVALIGFLFLFPVFNKFTARGVLFTSVAVNAMIIAIYAFTKNPLVFLFLAIINALFISLRVQAFGILLRINSSLKNINNNENQMFMLVNTGFVVGPLLAGFVADKLSVNAVLLLSSLFLLLSVYSITMYTTVLEKKKQHELKKISPLNNIKHYFKSERRTLSYILTCGLELWWAIPYIFIPLEMIKLGLPIYYVGIFLFLLCIPNIIVEQKMARKTPKNLITIIITGYMITFFFGVVAAFSVNIYIILLCLILASFGLGYLEPTVESHFFSVVSEEQAERYYGTYFTAKRVGGFVGQFGMAVILLFLPISIGIFIVSLVMFSLAMVAAKHKRYLEIADEKNVIKN